MNKIKYIFKITKNIVFYIISFFILISIINMFVPIAADSINYSTKIYKKIFRTISGIKNNPYHKPNFKNLNWAKEHFQEFLKLKVEYHDYLIWRRVAFDGKTIKIDKNGFRLNNYDEEMVSFKNSDAWFFGGSTMWGSGSRNEDTIPSKFERISNIKSINFGETGYTSTQELNLLIKYISFSNPKIVVFYDGVNDIYHKCRKENNFYSSSIEKKIKPIVEEKVYTDWYNFETKNVLKNNLTIIKNLKKSLIQTFGKKNTSRLFDCDLNEKKSQLIVQNLINNWKLAKYLTENQTNPGIFIPILQPVSFLSKSKTEHLDNYTDEVKNQFIYMYKLIKAELKKNNFNYLDFTSTLDDHEYFFWDHAHVTPNGNIKIAEAIFKETLKQNLLYDK